MAQLAKLSDLAIRSAKGKEKPYKLADGGGLHLLIKPDGSKYWRFNFRFAGKDRTQAFGVYPEVSAKAARAAHQAARTQIAAGIDPMEERRQGKLAVKAAASDDFETLAREMWDRKRGAGRSVEYVDEVLSKLEKDAFPWIGHRPIGQIKTPEILAIMERVEHRAPETARRIRGFIGQVMRYAIAKGKMTDDPTIALRGAVITPQGGHFAAITDPAEFAQFLRDLYSYKGELVTCALIRLSPLLFQRPTELRQARWDEFDLAGQNWGVPMWEIPADRFSEKGGTKIARTGWQSHLVPLCQQAVEILTALHPLTGHREFVFHSSRKPGQCLSESTMLQAMRRMGYANKMTVHGFRASARTLAAERMRTDERILELQISHKVADPLGRAYNRTQFLDERVAFMQKWADYLDELVAGPSVKLQLVRSA